MIRSKTEWHAQAAAPENYHDTPPSSIRRDPSPEGGSTARGISENCGFSHGNCGDFLASPSVRYGALYIHLGPKIYLSAGTQERFYRA